MRSDKNETRRMMGFMKREGNRLVQGSGSRRREVAKQWHVVGTYMASLCQ